MTFSDDYEEAVKADPTREMIWEVTEKNVEEHGYVRGLIKTYRELL